MSTSPTENQVQLGCGTSIDELQTKVDRLEQKIDALSQRADAPLRPQ